MNWPLVERSRSQLPPTQTRRKVANTSLPAASDRRRTCRNVAAEPIISSFDLFREPPTSWGLRSNKWGATSSSERQHRIHFGRQQLAAATCGSGLELLAGLGRGQQVAASSVVFVCKLNGPKQIAAADESRSSLMMLFDQLCRCRRQQQQQVAPVVI